MSIVIGMLLFPSISGRSQILFDGALGTTPDAQGWSYTALSFGQITHLATNGVTLLDTSNSAQSVAGWSHAVSPPLDRLAGFALAFGLKLDSEAHSDTNHAGLSLVILDGQTNGVEIGFWPSAIFARSDSPFSSAHAEDSAFITTNDFSNYALVLLANNYVLYANGAVILTGAVREYVASFSFLFSYRAPNVIFFGDNSTPASISARLRAVALVRQPTVSSPVPGVLTWNGVSNLTYTVQVSSNLVNWTTAGTASSGSGVFWFTNTAAPASQYLRVAFP